MKDQLTFSNSNEDPVRSIINYHLSHVANKVVDLIHSLSMIFFIFRGLTLQLHEIEKSDRAAMCDLGIREYIHVCVALEEVNNYHTLQAVLCALLQVRT